MFVIIEYYEMKVFDTRNLKERDILFDWIAIKKDISPHLVCITSPFA